MSTGETTAGRAATDGGNLGLPKTLLLVRSLARGGAQRQVVTLACGLRARGCPVAVACFYPGGAYEQKLRDAGVPLFDLGKRGRWDVAGFLLRFWKLLRRQQPHIIYSFLPTENLVALAMRCAFPSVRVVWGVNASKIEFTHYDWLARVTYRIESLTARFADADISNSETGARLRIEQGFPESRMHVIPNGIDTDYFRFDAVGRRRVRGEWRVADGESLVGLVARLDPIKDHATFLHAAALLAKRSPSWRFVCVGVGAANYTAAMHDLCREHGLSDRVIWAGARDDMAAVYSALDIAVCSSISEGLPNAVAEAMACEVPCVVTDVGDSARVVGDLGMVVPPGQPLVLAEGVETLWQRRAELDGQMGNLLRRSIADRYAVDLLLRRTVEVLKAVSSGTEPSPKATL